MGRVWVQEYDAAGADSVDWTVVGPGGELLASARVPRAVSFRDAGTDWVLVRVLDELGVERIRLASIEIP